MPSETNKQRFLKVLEELGGQAGNKRLRESLGWQENTYRNAHVELVDEGRIVPGRGRGGSVRIVHDRNTTHSTQEALTMAAGSTSSPADGNGERQAAASQNGKKPARPSKKQSKANGTRNHRGEAPHSTAGGDLNQIEQRLWSGADQLRANSNYASNEYFLPVMGLIFLRHAYNRFLRVKAEVEGSMPSRGGKTRELRKADFSGRGAIYLSPESQFDNLVDLPEDRDLGRAIVHAVETIEEDYETLRGVLPKQGVPAA